MYCLSNLELDGEKRYIYALVDPRPEFKNNIYIGTSNNPRKRLLSHMSSAKREAELFEKLGFCFPHKECSGHNHKKNMWLYSLRLLNLRPVLLILGKDKGNRCEMEWIHHFRDLGFNMMNSPYAYNCWY